MVMWTCHPSYWEAEIGRIMVPSHPGQKSSGDPISMEKSWVWWCASVIPAMVESSSGQPGQKVRPYLQNNQSKKGWRHDSSCRAPIWQAQSHESKSQYCQKQSKNLVLMAKVWQCKNHCFQRISVVLNVKLSLKEDIISTLP
jgi:hypothetical protein